MRRKSKSPLRTLITNADRALQDFFRATYPDDKCESCWRPAELRHHYIEKSRSSLLRYCTKNLIAICKSCHAKHHLYGDPTVMGRVLKKRGMRWFNWVEKQKTISIQLDEPFIRRCMKKLGIKLETQ